MTRRISSTAPSSKFDALDFGRREPAAARAESGVELADFGIGKKPLGIGFRDSRKRCNLGQPGPYEKHGKIALGDLVAGDNQRSQLLGRKVLHLVQEDPEPILRSSAASQTATSRSGRSCSRFPVSPSPRAGSISISMSPTFTLNTEAKFLRTEAARCSLCPVAAFRSRL